MLKHWLEQLSPTLGNASALGSIIPNLRDDEKLLAQSFIIGVVEASEPTELKDRDLLTYIKLYAKYCSQDDKPGSLSEILTDEQLKSLKRVT